MSIFEYYIHTITMNIIYFKNLDFCIRRNICNTDYFRFQFDVYWIQTNRKTNSHAKYIIHIKNVKGYRGGG